MEGVSDMSLDIELYVDMDTGGEVPVRVTLWEGNITHNLVPMARAADVYTVLWAPRMVPAGELVQGLREGYDRVLERYPELTQHNPRNGWGNADNLLMLLREYREAAEKHPKAKIGISK